MNTGGAERDNGRQRLQPQRTQRTQRTQRGICMSRLRALAPYLQSALIAQRQNEWDGDCQARSMERYRPLKNSQQNKREHASRFPERRKDRGGGFQLFEEPRHRLFCRGDEFWNPQLAKRGFARIFQQPAFFFCYFSFGVPKEK